MVLFADGSYGPPAPNSGGAMAQGFQNFGSIKHAGGTIPRTICG